MLNKLAFVSIILSVAIMGCHFTILNPEGISNAPMYTQTETASSTPSVTFTVIPSFTPTNTPLTTNTPTLTPTNTRIYVPPSGGGDSESSGCGATLNAGFENQVINLINQQRASNGLNPLAVSGSLAVSTRAHSVDMACNDFFTHAGGVAENIAAGYDSPSSAVSGWMASDGHRANILSASYTQIGVGYAYYAGSTYGHYWTAQFSP